MNYFACCYNVGEQVIEKSLTVEAAVPPSAGIVAEMNGLDRVEPMVDTVVMRETGIDISGVLCEIVKKDIEPVIESETDVLLSVAEKTVEDVVAPVIKEFDTVVPLDDVKKILSYAQVAGSS